ncbi:MAG: hypothetical protein HQL45_17795, partial [Alphaproteobacteria bacterium]|nr:hypothetical protein [Alphaproteobacteria bacterium]
MTKTVQQSAYTLPDSAKTAIRDRIGKNEGVIPHPYLDSKGLITIGVGFNVDSKADFLKLNLRKNGENGQEGPLMTAAEKSDAYDAMVKKRTEENGNHKAAEDYKKVTKAYLGDTDVNTRLDQEIASRVPNIRKKIGAEPWDKLTDGQKATIAAVHFNIGNLDGSPKLVEAAKKGDAAAIARESHTIANKVKNAKGEVIRHERNWEAEMRNHCGALGLEAYSDACWRSLAAEHKDKPEEQRKLETFHPSIQKILDEPAKPEEKKDATAEPQPPPAEPFSNEPPSSEPPTSEAHEGDNASGLVEMKPKQKPTYGADGEAILQKLLQPLARPAYEVAVKSPGIWTEEEAK